MIDEWFGITLVCIGLLLAMFVIAASGKGGKETHYSISGKCYQKNVDKKWGEVKCPYQ